MRTMLRNRRIWMILSLILLANTGFSQLTQQWAARFNGTGNGADQAKSLAIDNDGNVYITGSATGTGTGYDFTTNQTGKISVIK